MQKNSWAEKRIYWIHMIVFLGLDHSCLGLFVAFEGRGIVLATDVRRCTGTAQQFL